MSWSEVKGWWERKDGVQATILLDTGDYFGTLFLFGR